MFKKFLIVLLIFALYVFTNINILSAQDNVVINSYGLIPEKFYSNITLYKYDESWFTDPKNFISSSNECYKDIIIYGFGKISTYSVTARTTFPPWNSLCPAKKGYSYALVKSDCSNVPSHLFWLDCKDGSLMTPNSCSSYKTNIFVYFLDCMDNPEEYGHVCPKNWTFCKDYADPLPELLKQYQYVAVAPGETTGSEAYCVQPGKKYRSGEKYKLDESFDVSSCTNSKESYACGAAYILTEAHKLGYSYGTTLTALRLLTAKYAKEDFADTGWWQEGEKKSVEELYKLTANKILYGGYNNKDAKENGIGLLYADSSSLSNLTKAINLFKSAWAGKPYTATTSAVTKSTYYLTFDEKKEATFKIYAPMLSQYTSLASASVTLTSNTEGLTVVSTPKCVGTGGVRCDVINVTLKCTGECPKGAFSVRMSTTNPNITFGGAIKRYIHSTNDKEYQKMMVYEGNTKTVYLGFNSPTVPQPPVCEKLDIDYCGMFYDCTKDDDECDERGGERTSSSGKLNTAHISDPAMDTIISTCDTKKTKYLNTAYLNSPYCKLYCREDIHFEFMRGATVTNSKDVNSGRYFQHDLGGYFSKPKGMNGNLFSTTIKGIKECVATDINYAAWKSAYNNAQEAVRNAWNNLKKWEALMNDSPSTKHESKSFTCSTSTCCDYDEVTDEFGNVTTQCVDYVDANCNSSATATILTWSASYYYYDSSWVRRSTTASVSDGDVSCPSGCCRSNPCRGGCTADNGDPNYVVREYNKALSAYESALSSREALIVEIQNCNLYKDLKVNKNIGGFSINIDTESVYDKIEDNYPDNFKPTIEIEYEDDDYGKSVKVDSKAGKVGSTSTTWCNGCVHTSEILYGSNEIQETYWVCDNNSCSKGTVLVPNNTKAKFTTTAGVQYWQDEEYFVEIYTGKAYGVNKDKEKLSSLGVDPKKDINPNFEKLPLFSYPIILSTKDGKYDIITRYYNLGDSTRDPAIKFDDSSVSDENKFTCFYKVVNETTCFDNDNDGKCDGLGFIFRPIDMNDVFPDDSRIPKTNWKNATDIIKAMETHGNNIWDSEHLYYSFVLTPENIKSIRSYNTTKESGSGYLDQSMVCAEGFKRCRSDFLNNISSFAFESFMPRRNQ